MIEVGGESNGEQQGTDHESLQSTTPAVASLLQATQASGDLLAHSRAPQMRSVVSSAEASAHEVATTVVSSSDVSLTGSTTSYQHYLAPAVSIGGHIQNITIPAQVSVTSPGVAVAAATPSQNLARILAAASQQGYSSPPLPSVARTAAGGLLGSSRLAATSPAALLATTQPPAQQQAIVMDTLTQDEQRLHSYSFMTSLSPPRTPQRSPTTAAALPPQFVVPPKQTPVLSPAPPPASPSTSTGGATPPPPPARPGGLLQLVGVECPRAAKRIKLEERPPANEEVASMRYRVLDHRQQELLRNKERYVEHLTELFFLQNGGNMMDYFAWKRRPTPQLLALLRAHALDSEDEEDPARLLDTRPPSALLAATAAAAAATTAAVLTTAVVTTAVAAVAPSPLTATSAATVATTLSTADAAMAAATTSASAIASQLAASPGQALVPATSPSSVPSSGPRVLADPPSSSPSSSQQTPQHQLRPPSSPLRAPAIATPTSSGSSPSKGGASRQPQSAVAAAPATPATPSATGAAGAASSTLTLSASRLTTRQHSISAVYDSSIGSQEEIVERAKQEAYVMQRIAELRKDGMWSARRLPKVQEPPRAKAHWDYLLEEMVWLATDFAQERKWKKAAAKKCARMVLRYHQERELRAERAEREELQRLRRVAAQVAKEIKQFWANIEKLVEFKQQTRLEEKRKKALDLHLNFIMDQTEKYSSWLREGMAASKGSAEASEATTPAQAPASPARSGSSNDEDFQPDVSDSDDEETIDREETTAPTDEEEQSRELELLHKEGELPIEQLLDSLPPEILERPASPLPHTNGSHKVEEDDEDGSSECSGSPIDVESTKADEADDADDEFMVEDEEDDEATLEEQEEQEKSVDHKEELEDLLMEGEMPLDALCEKYGGAYASDAEVPNAAGSSGEDEEEDDTADNERDTDNSDEEMDEEEEDDDMETSSEGEVQEDIGMEYLINPMSDEVVSEGKTENAAEDTSKGPTKEITDIAATAQSFQPKGNTLSTTQVQTKVPWLLKHSLREYQHIGLDWLVTMHDKKLNGILADEMGLGKTIQTISLLAHMACDKGIWGPHLIVVPTSVMLNWEMEFKKWCPAFKILTYYGIPKERKQKRQGWTKPNAFHVCITSYKLVVQDHQAFRRKKWKYLILDEAQHIKNFKSQRWQMLLNFQSSRRLLLTGTPLQNSLMELWSLMHFLMPSVFQSHREFREWFANPVTGMIEGSSDYNESLIKRLHKVLRPFLLRRLKCEVEKQLPKKYEHVVLCRLSKRQRFLYDDFMAQTKTKETLATGNFMSVINVLMQLRKVCNHPNMFEPRPILSPYRMEGLVYYTASLVYDICKYDPFKHVSFSALNLLLADVELCLTAFAAHRIKKFQTTCHFVETIESHPPPPPRCPPGKIRLHIRTSAPSAQSGAARAASPMVAAGHHGPHHQRLVAATPGAHHGAAGMVVRPGHQGVPAGTTFAMTARHGAVLSQGHHPGLQQPQQQRLVMVSTPGAVTPRAQGTVVAAGGQAPSSAGGGGGEYMLQLVQKSGALGGTGAQQVMGSPITLQIQPSAHGAGPARVAVPFGIGRIVQTTSGQHLLLTPAAAQQSPQGVPDGTTAGAAQLQQHQTVMLATSAGQAVVRTTTALTQMGRVVTSAAGSPASTPVSSALGAKPVMRVSPLNANSQATPTGVTKTVNAKTTVIAPVKSSGATSSTESSIQRSPYYLDSLESRRRQQRREKLRLLGHTNALRCAACPTYGRDLVEAVTVVHDARPVARCPWGGTGYVACLNAPAQGETQLWRYTRTLRSLVRTPPQLLDELRDMVDRFVFSVPKVTAPRIEMRVSHPSPSSLNAERVLEERLAEELGPRCAFLHPVMCNLQTQFPELRLIQYDCGKLQVLDKLLWQLRGGQHRVLIFTQMTRMLDVLEQFLNYHGHTYLRLDGSTRVDQRQALMERFNADRRIFCFILSTRSGGIGVNLTGADTVVFYDSDWNPTMDAQAQDRCHRIGQTRDVHIYRLISEKTVEENILKKANQKRMLGDLAIEGGNFTTAFFKQNTLKDLFGTDFDLTLLERSEESQKEDRPVEVEKPEKFSSVEFEKALGMAEEELDVQAAHTARAEAAAELAEFDESIPLDTDSRDEDKSQAEEELDKLMDQLTPVEKYAMQFLESLQEPLTLEQLKQAEEEIEAQKKDWELGRLKAIKEEEERRAGYRDDEEAPALVYSREDAYTQVPKSGRERRSSRGAKGTTTCQVNGAPAVPKRTSKRRAAAAAAAASAGEPVVREEVVAPPKKKRAVSPVQNHRHRQLVPAVVAAAPEAAHQRAHPKQTLVPSKSMEQKKEQHQPLAIKLVPEHKNQTADKTKVTDKNLLAVKPLPPPPAAAHRAKGVDKSMLAVRSPPPPSLPAPDKMKAVNNWDTVAVKPMPPSAVDKTKVTDKNLPAVRQALPPAGDKVVLREGDLAVERTLPVMKVSLPAGQTEKPLEKMPRAGNRGVTLAAKAPVSEPVGNHVGSPRASEKPTANSQSRMKPRMTNQSEGSSPMLKPFSNPNLVIRTRRARAAEMEPAPRAEEKLKLGEKPEPKQSTKRVAQLTLVHEPADVVEELAGPAAVAEEQTVFEEVVMEPVSLFEDQRVEETIEEVVEESIEEMMVQESIEVTMLGEDFEEVTIEENVEKMTVEEGIEELAVVEGADEMTVEELVLISGEEEDEAPVEAAELDEEQVFEFVLDPELVEEIGPDLLTEFVSKLTPELFSRLSFVEESDAKAEQEDEESTSEVVGEEGNTLEVLTEAAETAAEVPLEVVEGAEEMAMGEVEGAEEMAMGEVEGAEMAMGEVEGSVEVPLEEVEGSAEVSVGEVEGTVEVLLEGVESNAEMPIEAVECTAEVPIEEVEFVVDLLPDLEPVPVPVLGEVVMNALGPELVPPPAETTVVVSTTEDEVPPPKARVTTRSRRRHTRSSRRSRE
uniref:Putative chromatin remodeling complex wstf-iswi small subunit n=1 Tax=Amblyomma aureolatum TaxID=187763 RepID=A0A1E1X3Q5_9ACAR